MEPTGDANICPSCWQRFEATRNNVARVGTEWISLYCEHTRTLMRATLQDNEAQDIEYYGPIGREEAEKLKAEWEDQNT